MMNRSTRRRGGACPMILGVLSLLIALAALVIALCRDPMQPGLTLRHPFNPLSGYDVESAGGAAKAQLEMRLKNDIRAGLELERRSKDKQLEEKFNTFEIKEEAGYNREKDPKAKKGADTGEFKILFVTFKEDGEERKDLVVMEKQESGLWRNAFGLDSMEVAGKNKELAEKMDKWKGRPAAPKFEFPNK